MAVDTGTLKFILDDLTGPEVRALVERHLEGMHLCTPREHVHALDVDRLRAPEIRFWSAWTGPVLIGCGALKQLDPWHGEIKSMRVHDAYLGQGFGRAILGHLLREAANSGMRRVSLETGSTEDFGPAIRLYESAGFVRCGPFGAYREGPYSVFMTRSLEAP